MSAHAGRLACALHMLICGPHPSTMGAPKDGVYIPYRDEDYIAGVLGEHVCNDIGRETRTRSLRNTSTSRTSILRQTLSALAAAASGIAKSRERRVGEVAQVRKVFIACPGLGSFGEDGMEASGGGGCSMSRTERTTSVTHSGWKWNDPECLRHVTHCSVPCVGCTMFCEAHWAGLITLCRHTVWTGSRWLLTRFLLTRHTKY